MRPTMTPRTPRTPGSPDIVWRCSARRGRRGVATISTSRYSGKVGWCAQQAQASAVAATSACGRTCSAKAAAASLKFPAPAVRLLISKVSLLVLADISARAKGRSTFRGVSGG